MSLDMNFRLPWCVLSLVPCVGAEGKKPPLLRALRERYLPCNGELCRALDILGNLQSPKESIGLAEMQCSSRLVPLGVGKGGEIQMGTSRLRVLPWSGDGPAASGRLQELDLSLTLGCHVPRDLGRTHGRGCQIHRQAESPAGCPGQLSAVLPHPARPHRRRGSKRWSFGVSRTPPRAWPAFGPGRLISGRYSGLSGPGAQGRSASTRNAQRRVLLEKGKAEVCAYRRLWRCQPGPGARPGCGSHRSLWLVLWPRGSNRCAENSIVLWRSNRGVFHSNTVLQ